MEYLKNPTTFNEDQVKILEKIEIKDLITNFKNQKLKDRKYPRSIDINCPIFKENNFILSNKAIEKCNKV